MIQLNGQNVEGAEQLRRMLKEIPSGRKVSIEISRDGNIQTMAVELADRKVLGHDVWNQIGDGGDVFTPVPSMGILSGGGRRCAVVRRISHAVFRQQPERGRAG